MGTGTMKLASYAASKGMAVLGSIGPGEGFWVNASDTVVLADNRARPAAPCRAAFSAGVGRIPRRG